MTPCEPPNQKTRRSAKSHWPNRKSLSQKEIQFHGVEDGPRTTDRDADAALVKSWRDAETTTEARMIHFLPSIQGKDTVKTRGEAKCECLAAALTGCKARDRRCFLRKARMAFFFGLNSETWSSQNAARARDSSWLTRVFDASIRLSRDQDESRAKPSIAAGARICRWQSDALFSKAVGLRALGWLIEFGGHDCQSRAGGNAAPLVKPPSPACAEPTRERHTGPEAWGDPSSRRPRLPPSDVLPAETIKPRALGTEPQPAESHGAGEGLVTTPNRPVVPGALTCRRSYRFPASKIPHRRFPVFELATRPRNSLSKRPVAVRNPCGKRPPPTESGWVDDFRTAVIAHPIAFEIANV